MAEIKWIKLYIDIWNNRKIKQIEKLPDGDAILVIWLKILTLAGNVNDGGLVYFTQDIPFTDQMLATEFGKPLATIQMALKVFEQFGMIEVVNDIICVSNWEKYQAIEGMEKVKEQNRIRQKRWYDNQKQIPNVIPNVSLTLPNATDIDIEKDKEIRNKEYKKKRFAPPTLEEVISYFTEKQLKGDPQKFYDYYSVADWHDSKGNPIKSWKQKALAVWDKPSTGNAAPNRPTFTAKEEMTTDEVDLEQLREKMFNGKH